MWPTTSGRLITPPRYAGISAAKAVDWANLSKGVLPQGLPMVCAQGPGDMLLLPAVWGHSTVNKKFTVGTGNIFCDTRLAHYMSDPDCRKYCIVASIR